MQTLFQYYTKPSNLVIGFNTILIKNSGTQTAMINNFPVAAGASFGWGHNQNEVDITPLRVDFPGGNDGAAVWVIYSIYAEPEVNIYPG